MKESEYILIIVGEETYTSEWINWEIERAKQTDTNLKFAAVKIKWSNTNPQGLPSNASFSNGFTLDGIVTALNNARTNN